MKRSAEMKRSPMKPRKKPMRRRSKKRAALYKQERVPLVRRLLKMRPRCEAGDRISMLYVRLRVLQWKSRCQGRSRHVHEILARSAGGSITDESNLLCVCPACHGWIGDFPKLALELGLRRSRYS